MASRELVSVSGHEVSQADLARILPLTSRQIRNLEAEGMPCRAEGNRKLYPIPEAVAWWSEREIQKRLAKFEASTLDDLRAKKLEVEVRMAELEAGEREGVLVFTDVMEKQVGEAYARIRARIVAMKGTLPPRVTGLDSPREARAVIGPAMDELLEELRQVVEGYADEQDEAADDAA